MLENGPLTQRVREILTWYAGNPPGMLEKMARMMSRGRLAGIGKFRHSTRGPRIRALFHKVMDVYRG